jgi:membrane protease YdiL (CAAX protease family)
VSAAPAIGLAGWAFLVFAGGVLPLAAGAFALGERRRVNITSRADEHVLETGSRSRVQLYVQALFTHALLLGAAVGAGRADDVMLLPPVTIGLHSIAMAALTLLAVVVIGELSWRSRSPAERERLWVRRILPHTSAERRMWVVVSAGAAIAEEVAYRGVFVALATSATGNLAAAIIASAAAFAAVHAPQGFAGVGYVLVIALVHQALVLLTGTLLLAIAVHFAYDVIAGLWLARRHGLTP